MIPLPNISTQFRGNNVVQIKRRPITAKRDGAVPMQLSSFVPEQHLIKNGFPHVPKLWVGGKTLANAAGVVYDDNTHPWDLDIPALHSRFLFNATLWNSSAGDLLPLHTEGIDYYFAAAPLNQPRLESIEYRVGKKLIDVSTLRFDPGTSLHSSFNSGLDDASVFTLGLVCRVYGSEPATLMRIGDTGSTVEINVGQRISVNNGETELFMDTPKAPGAVEPLFIFVSSTPSRTLLTVGMEGHLYQRQIPSRDAERKLDVSFGQSLQGSRNLMANIFDFFICSQDVSHRELSALMSTVYR